MTKEERAAIHSKRPTEEKGAGKKVRNSLSVRLL
jgi:hypothetical protein